MKTEKKPQHTPGPWKIGNVPGREAFCVYDNQANEYISTIWFSERDVKEGAANARLIAAAPDLLEAVKAALLVAEDLDAKGQYIDYPRGMAFDGSLSGGLRAAILRATEGK